jgi:hypothetical protein
LEDQVPPPEIQEVEPDQSEPPTEDVVASEGQLIENEESREVVASEGQLIENEKSREVVASEGQLIQNEATVDESKEQEMMELWKAESKQGAEVKPSDATTFVDDPSEDNVNQDEEGPPEGQLIEAEAAKGEIIEAEESGVQITEIQDSGTEVGEQEVSAAEIYHAELLETASRVVQELVTEDAVVAQHQLERSISQTSMASGTSEASVQTEVSLLATPLPPIHIEEKSASVTIVPSCAILSHAQTSLSGVPSSCYTPAILPLSMCHTPVSAMTSVMPSMYPSIMDMNMNYSSFQRYPNDDEKCAFVSTHTY